VTNAIDPLLYVWNLHHNFWAVISPERNLLDTNMFYPTTNTIAYSDHLFGQSIILFPLFLLIKNPFVIQNIYIISTFVLGGFGMYLLCFYFTKSFWVSFTSGILYTFSLYHIDHAGQVSTTSIQWIPFIFLYLFKSFDTKKSKDIVLFWLFFVLNFLSTLYYGLFICVPIGIFVLINYKSWKFFLRWLLLGIPFFVVLIIASYPYLLFTLENPTVKRSIEESTPRSAKVVDYFSSTLIHDRALYLGIPTILFALFSIVRPINKKVTFFFFSTGIVCLVFSLGPFLDSIPLPYYVLYKIVPIFQAIRVPARFGIITIACFSLLAGFGLHSFLKNFKQTVAQLVILAIVLVLCFLQFVQHPLHFVPVPTLASAPNVYSWLKEQPEGIVLELPLRHGYHSNLIEKQVSLNYNEIGENDNYIAETYRLYFSIIHKKKMINGYSSYFPTTYQDIATAMETFPAPYSIEQIKKYNVGFIILHKNQYGSRWPEVEKEIEKVEKLEKIKDFETESVYRLSK
jgi:hypothetical protein